jgi:adenylate cyclase
MFAPPRGCLGGSACDSAETFFPRSARLGFSGCKSQALVRAAGDEGSLPLTIASSVHDEASVGDAPSADEIRAQMRRILAEPTLQASPARRELLRFVVEETLAGRADRLKGFTIALAVFDRKDDFDPQTDPVVRVEARRLRRDLDGYYVTAGKRDPVVISIPKGGYVPHFEGRDLDPAPDAPPKADARPRRSRLAIALLAGAFLGVFGWLGAGQLDSKLWPSSGGSEGAPTALPRGPKIAVLPFANLSRDPEQTYFAEGITDQIVTDLARFKALFVLSTQSTAKYQDQSVDPRQLKRELGIDYLLTGSVRRDEGQIRLSTRLVDAESGEIVWSDSYSDELTPSNVFEIQDDVSQQVSAVVASNYGVIAEAGQTEARSQPPTSLAAYDCVLRYYHYQRSFDRQEHAGVRACLERAVELDPDYADAWAVLANVYAQEYRFGYNPRPQLYNARERSLAAANRAVELEPRNPTAQLMLANALFDRHDLVGFKAAGEQAIALNPNDPEPLVHFGLRLVYMGEWQRGLAFVTKAIALNPDHPEWYRDPIIFYDYQTGDYQRALVEAQKQKVRRPWRFLFSAMILGQLGRGEEAQPAIKAALELKPDVRERLWDMARVWNVPDPQIEHMADGLRKAGLAIAPAPPAS